MTEAGVALPALPADVGRPGTGRRPRITSTCSATARTALAVLTALAALLGACAGPRPPVQLYHLRAAPPVSVAAPSAERPAPAAPAAPAAPTVATTATAPWQLLLPVRVPDYLDRDAIVVPEGRAGLQAQSEHRWAEPLRDSVPRLLHSDLAALLGQQRVWTAPVPPGVRIERQWRVELLALEAAADRRSVTLQARWAVLDPSGALAPQVQLTTLQVPAEGPQIDALVAAQRLALWRLAEQLAQAAGRHAQGLAGQVSGKVPDVIDRSVAPGPDVFQGLQRHVQTDPSAMLEALAPARFGLNAPSFNAPAP